MMKTSHILVTLQMLILFSHQMVNGKVGKPEKQRQRREQVEGSQYDDYYHDDHYSYDYDSHSYDYDYDSHSYDYDDDYYCDYYPFYCSSDGEEGSNCFSANMEVFVQGKGAMPMESLQVGDYVKIGNGEGYERVYAWGHRVPDRYAEFVQLHTNAGTPLEMTGAHLVFVDGKTNPVRADSIQVGDRLRAENIDAVVEKIELVTRNGIYNPLTSSGSIQVNGVTASSYVSFQKENNEYVEFQGGVEIMSHHDAAHIAMTPYRFYCTNLAICDANSAMPFYVTKGIELIEWSKQKNILVQLFVYASFRILLLASILMACAVFVIPAYLLSGSSIFQMQRVISHISTMGSSLNKGLKMKKVD